MMAQRQRRRLRDLRNDQNLAQFVLEGTATGKQLGTGSYGSVEEVGNLKIIEKIIYKLFYDSYYCYSLVRTPGYEATTVSTCFI